MYVDEKRQFFTESWPKKCACGEDISEEKWETLRYVGVQKVPLEFGLPDLELRDCSRCASTISIVVPNDIIMSV